MPVLIGSRALNFWNPSFDLVQKNPDWDVISETSISGCEHHPVDFLNNREMLIFASPYIIELPNGGFAYVMTLAGLGIIKRSHLHRDLSFGKHITHYHKHGLHDVVSKFKNDSKQKKFLLNRIDLTKKQFPQITPNLMKPTQEFFSDYVVKKYDHDWLHELYAYNEVPMYIKMQRDNTLAWCHKDMWDTFSYLEKLQCVAEEVYVISTERFLVPSEFTFPRKTAFMKSLEKVCTTLCSGFFRDFAIENYPQIVDMFDFRRFSEVENLLKTCVTPKLFNEGK